MIYETFSNGILPETARKSVVALIFKKGDRKLLKNYRPICLSNYDYKILSFVLANRLQKVIHKLINPVQTGYIKNRSMNTNIRLIMEIIEHCEMQGSPGAIISLDFEKAFDSLNWDFMLTIMSKYGFGDFFSRWIKILYNDPLLLIKNNGWLSKEIPMLRGIRQGCPLSALLFILSVECLSIKLRESKVIKGIEIGSVEFRILQYADDSILTVANDTSLQNSLKVIQDFTKVSGLKLNFDKCEGLWLGSLKGSPEDIFGITFKEQPLRVLGVYVGKNESLCQSKNWDLKIEKVEKLLTKWESRKINLYDKVMVVKSLVMPIITLNLSVLVVPIQILNQIQKLIFNFIWGKIHKVKMKTVIGHYEDGGLGVPDIFSRERALKASWFSRLLSESNLSNIFETHINRCGISLAVLLKMT